MTVNDAYNIARGLHILAVIAWMAALPCGASRRAQVSKYVPRY